MHANRNAKLSRVPGPMRFDHKIAVIGALQRDGDVRLEVYREKQITREVLHSFIKAKLADETELIATGREQSVRWHCRRQHAPRNS